MTNLYQAKDDGLVPVTRKRLANEDQLQCWIASNPRLAGLDALVLGREITTEFGGRIDVFALDREGNTIIIECKRDRTPRDIVAQILDYASWVSKLSTRQVHEIARNQLGKPLEAGFQERFGIPLPESLNERHDGGSGFACVSSNKCLIYMSHLDKKRFRMFHYAVDLQAWRKLKAETYQLPVVS
jgi:hypothetical protein